MKHIFITKQNKNFWFNIGPSGKTLQKISIDDFFKSRRLLFALIGIKTQISNIALRR
jgi:hypothetical protein